MRDKTHMESVVKWAEFIKDKPRSQWKGTVNAFINSTYEKADKFYKRLQQTEKGREILERLRKERINSGRR